VKKFYPDIHKTRLKVGIFTLVIAALLLFGYLWLSNRISVRKQQILKLSFEDVMGLEIGDKAMFRGMEVGRIKTIESRGQDILVTAKINRDIVLNEGAAFYITDSSLMGGKALNIRQGEGSEPLSMALVHKGVSPTGVVDVIGKAAVAIDGFNSVLDQLKQEGGFIAKSSGLLDEAGSAVRSVDNLAMNMNSELSQALRRIDQLTTQINQIVSANSDNVNSLLAASPKALGNLNSTLDSLQALSARLSRTVQAVNSGSGTAARLVGEDELYNKLLESVQNLDALVQDIKANPKKYVKFSLF